MSAWYSNWFNDDYLSLYAHHDASEADRQAEALIQRLELPPNSPILDLACGNGRHLAAFARRGMAATGIDLSSVMVAKAKERLVDTSAVVLQRDMRDLSDLGPFCLVASFFTSFGYLESIEEDRKVLQQIRQTLLPDGHFFIDTLNPTYVTAHLKPYSEEVIDEKRVVIHRRVADNTLIKTIDYGDRTYTENVRLYPKEALCDLLVEEGLTIIDTCSDYLWNPWTPNNPRILLLAKKERR